MIVWLAFAVSALLTWWLAGSLSPFKIHDAPNERSLHEQPTPRTGGLAIVFSLAVAWGVLLWEVEMPSWLVRLAGAALIVAAVSFADDLYDLSPLARLPTHVLAALLVVWNGEVPIWMAVIAVPGLAWMLNLYNFMDGMDGFAGGMTVAGFGFLGLAGQLSGDVLYAQLCWCVASAAAGFLLFNFPPARIFMGDIGSATLGLLAGGLAWVGWQQGLFSLWYPLLVFSPFILDATVTLIRRMLRFEKIWQAHRSHYYQRLVRLGWGHRRTVLVEYVLMLLMGCWALLMHRGVISVELGLASWGIVSVSLLAWAECFLKRANNA